MAYAWEPRWEPYRVEVNGIIINTCRDKITRIIACPICINALSKCLNRSESAISSEEVSENAFLFTEEDLIIHIRDYHARSYLVSVASGERSTSKQMSASRDFNDET